MDRISIQGGRPLKGKIIIGGAKNAALPLMAAGLLAEQPLILDNVPDLADISSMTNLLLTLGTKMSFSKVNGVRQVTLITPDDADTFAPYDLVRKMRASVLVLGPLLARFGKARVSLPGGCAIGNRPIDLHLAGMEALGATVNLTGGYVEASAPNGMIGNRVVFPKVSVGATENLLMAAAMAKGETVLVNAAREPEVVDLARCLMAMGVQIEGAGTDTIHIQGRDRLNPAQHRVVSDRIEAGTFAMAAAMTGGDVQLVGVTAEGLAAVIDILKRTGAGVVENSQGLRVYATNRLQGVDVMTEPFPGFPTDLQAQYMALLAVSEGAAMVTETIFENRFMHVPELSRMGANINVHGSSALVRGVQKLVGAQVMATDLRASVSLVLAGLVAEGETVISRVYHLDRGYERLEEKLAACGAVIERLAA
jgi:UDP-N-acetylglucosamine 1-carboxyvinyltransferase